MTTESLLWVVGGSWWCVMSLQMGEVVEEKSKNGFLVECPWLSFPSIILIAVPWVILPPSGHWPLLRARIMDSLDNPVICWPGCSTSPVITVLLVLTAVSLREGCIVSDTKLDLERGSSLKGSLSRDGKYPKAEEKEVSLWEGPLESGAQEVRKKLSFIKFWLLSTSAEKSSKRMSLDSWFTWGGGRGCGGRTVRQKTWFVNQFRGITNRC